MSRPAISNSSSRRKTAPRCATCMPSARSWAATCRKGWPPRRHCRFLPWPRTRLSPRLPPARRCPPRWRSCASWPTCSRTRSWAPGSCPSWRTRRARSAWPTCSSRWASIRALASATSRKTSARCCRTGKRWTARSWRRASAKPARSPAGLRLPPATACTAFRCCRSTSITRCSASSGWATRSGLRPTSARAASCSAPLPDAPHWPAKGCSTRTAAVTWWRRPFPIAVPTTRPLPASWP